MDLKKNRTGEWRKMYLEEIHNLYSALNLKWQTLKMKWIGYAA
jgi:hypothetical protein